MLEFVTCKHCVETGTCTNGHDGGSCTRCIAYWKQYVQDYTPKEDDKGLVCSVCWGKGVTEPTSSKWQNRFTPILAMVFVLLAFLLVFIFGLFKIPDFDKVLVFAGTLIGSITGYYFGGEKVANKLVPTPNKPNIQQTNAPTQPLKP